MKKQREYIFLNKDTNFHGELVGSYIIVEGRFSGTIRAAKEVYLKDGCYIEGEIFTKKISADNGSVFHGELHMDDDPMQYKTDDNRKSDFRLKSTGSGH